MNKKFAEVKYYNDNRGWIVYLGIEIKVKQREPIIVEGLPELADVKETTLQILFSRRVVCQRQLKKGDRIPYRWKGTELIFDLKKFPTKYSNEKCGDCPDCNRDKKGK